MVTVAFVRLGFCVEDENANGPVQEYVAPATAGVDRLMVLPVQTGELLDADGVGSALGCVMLNVFVICVPTLSVMVTV